MNKEELYIDGYLEKFVENYKERSQEEIDRLNNIINELEKWLQDKIFNKAGSSIDIAIENHTYSKTLDKLIELKEDNKC